MKKHVLLAAALCVLTGCESGLDGYDAARKAIRDNSSDPSSVQFQELRPCSNDEQIVTGEYNQKNEMGGYTGFSSFFYDRSSGLLFSPQEKFGGIGRLSNGMTAFQIVAYETLAPRCYGNDIDYKFLYNGLTESDMALVNEMRSQFQKIIGN